MLFYNIVSKKNDLKKVYIQIMLVPNMHALLFCTILVFSYTFFFSCSSCCVYPLLPLLTAVEIMTQRAFLSRWGSFIFDYTFQMI